MENSGYEASLELRKLYEAIPDADAEKHGQLRVIDESRGKRRQIYFTDHIFFHASGRNVSVNILRRQPDGN